LHTIYPQFATRDQHGGGYQQQDANECFSELIREFADAAEIDVKEGNDTKKVSVRRFIEGMYDVKLKNLENEEEPVLETKETFMQVRLLSKQ
jgi:ubiquitin carboxyl-terminal hydrolase 14